MCSKCQCDKATSKRKHFHQISMLLEQNRFISVLEPRSNGSIPSPGRLGTCSHNYETPMISPYTEHNTPLRGPLHSPLFWCADSSEEMLLPLFRVRLLIIDFPCFDGMLPTFLYPWDGCPVRILNTSSSREYHWRILTSHSDFHMAGFVTTLYKGGSLSSKNALYHPFPNP